MSYSVESINSEDNSVQTQKALQEQILQMQQAKDAKTQENGTKVEEPTAVTSTESKTDTIEISAEGQKALEQMKAAKASGKPAASAPQTESTEKSTSETASVKEKTSSSASAVSESLDEEDSVSTADLYTMTESQLRSLVTEGTITRKEMQDELQRRSGYTETDN